MENQKRITSLAELQGLIGPRMMKEITDQAEYGDPEWLLDMIGELDYNGHALERFHGTLIKQGYRTANFDTDALMKELYTKHPFNRDKYNELARKEGFEELDENNKPIRKNSQ